MNYHPQHKQKSNSDWWVIITENKKIIIRFLRQGFVEGTYSVVTQKKKKKKKKKKVNLRFFVCILVHKNYVPPVVLGDFFVQ